MANESVSDNNKSRRQPLTADQRTALTTARRRYSIWQAAAEAEKAAAQHRNQAALHALEVGVPKSRVAEELGVSRMRVNQYAVKGAAVPDDNDGDDAVAGG